MTVDRDRINPQATLASKVSSPRQRSILLRAEQTGLGKRPWPVNLPPRLLAPGDIRTGMGRKDRNL